MSVATDKTRSRIIPIVILVFALINLLFLLTEIGINVLGAILPL